MKAGRTATLTPVLCGAFPVPSPLLLASLFVSPVLEPPTREEWLFVHGPLALALVAALGIETATARVPNWLSLPTLAYLLGARLVVGPAAPGWYFLSLLIGAAAVLGFVWRHGYMGGGSAKMAVAASAAFPPLQAIAFVVLIVVCCLSFVWTERWHGRSLMRGSLLLLVLAPAVCSMPDIVRGVGHFIDNRASIQGPADNSAPARVAPGAHDRGEDE